MCWKCAEDESAGICWGSPAYIEEDNSAYRWKVCLQAGDGEGFEAKTTKCTELASRSCRLRL